MALDFLVLLVNLLVWGLHARLPWQLGDGDPRWRRVWALSALPALGLSVSLTLLSIGGAPDAAVAWGMTDPLTGALPARLVAVAVLALALVDVVLLLGKERFGPFEWRLVGAFGVLGLATATLGSELLRIGWGPVPGRGALWLAIALRLPLALAAGELVAGKARLWTLLSGPSLAAAVALWPPTLRASLGADWLTLGAAVGLLLVARFLPGALGRGAGLAGVALAALFLVRAAELGSILGGGENLPLELLEP